MWWIFTPGIAVAGALAIGLDESSSTAVRIIVSAGALIGGFVLYPLRVRFLIRRRAMWRP